MKSNDRKINRIFFVGKATSGKTYLKDILKQVNVPICITWTTRKPRPNETNGVDYFFLSKEEFNKNIELGFFKEWTDFGGNLYGTSKEDYNTFRVFVVDPSGVQSLNYEDRRTSLIIFLDPEEKILRERMRAKRSWTEEEIEKRLEVDRVKFINFDTWDIKITDVEFNSQFLLSIL